MGCNESKQNVATGNTIPSRRPLLQRKSTASKTNKDYQEVPNAEPNADSSSVQKSDSNENGNVVVATSGNDVDEITVTNELKEEKVAEEDGKTIDPGKFVLSPDHYFSSRKDEDAAESVGTEEGYFSPPHDAVKDAVDEPVVIVADIPEKVEDEVEEMEKEEDSVNQVEETTGKSEELKDSDLVQEEVTAVEVITSSEDQKPELVPEEQSIVPSPTEPLDLSK